MTIFLTISWSIFCIIIFLALLISFPLWTLLGVIVLALIAIAIT